MQDRIFNVRRDDPESVLQLASLVFHAMSGEEKFMEEMDPFDMVDVMAQLMDMLDRKLSVLRETTPKLTTSVHFENVMRYRNGKTTRAIIVGAHLSI